MTIITYKENALGEDAKIYTTKLHDCQIGTLGEYKVYMKLDELMSLANEELKKENARLREALELIAKSKFYFARGEEEMQIRRVCEIAKEALKGKEE